MKLSGKMITTGGAIALLAASGLLDQKTPPTVANDNKAKIAAIL